MACGSSCSMRSLMTSCWPQVGGAPCDQSTVHLGYRSHAGTSAGRGHGCKPAQRRVRNFMLTLLLPASVMQARPPLCATSARCPSPAPACLCVGRARASMRCASLRLDQRHGTVNLCASIWLLHTNTPHRHRHTHTHTHNDDMYMTFATHVLYTHTHTHTHTHLSYGLVY
jgi:hypothetical protein